MQCAELRIHNSTNIFLHNYFSYGECTQKLNYTVEPQYACRLWFGNQWLYNGGILAVIETN